MQNATDKTDKLYPEIDEAGGLNSLLNDTFRQIGSLRTTRIDDNIGYVDFYHADVVSDTKLSQIMVASHEKLYLVDYWRDGVCLASGGAKNIISIAESVDFWMSNNVPTTTLAEKYPFIKPREKASAFDAGIEVEYTWNEILHNKSNAELHDFVVLAINDEVLGKLFPFISVSALCFSRCTGYVYDTDGLPIVIPKRFSHFANANDQSFNDNTFVVAKDTYNYLGEGTAEEALRIVRNNLSADTKPAVKGTADGKPC